MFNVMLLLSRSFFFVLLLFNVNNYKNDFICKCCEYCSKRTKQAMSINNINRK